MLSKIKNSFLLLVSPKQALLGLELKAIRHQKQGSLTDHKIQKYNLEFLRLLQKDIDLSAPIPASLQNCTHISSLEFLTFCHFPIHTLIKCMDNPLFYASNEKGSLLFRLAHSIDYHFRDPNLDPDVFIDALNEVLLSLTRSGIDLNATDCLGNTPISIALHRMSNETDFRTKAVLKAFILTTLKLSPKMSLSKNDKDTFKIIEDAFKSHDLDIIKAILTHYHIRYLANDQGNTLWHFAAMHLHEHEMLFRDVANLPQLMKVPIFYINIEGNTALHILCSHQINPKTHLDDRHLAREMNLLLSHDTNRNLYTSAHSLSGLLKTTPNTHHRKFSLDSIYHKSQ